MVKKWEAAYIAGIIDGEGTITLTRFHQNEHRRPCITISSNDKELLIYIQLLVGGSIYSKKNYNPTKHRNSFTLYIKKKHEVFFTLNTVYLFLRIGQKRKRAEWILKHYNDVTARNGKYTEVMFKKKLLFEENFFNF
ncbi:hypothetical protein JOC34_003026 [Virgibacillus halotolerans]|uniref:LAGLIDADG family homing endonuclease n=1 Tax=Virgibacillus halotolerans TaxID=1071053 RepID=UPI00195FBD5D|nr:LAGLIDADG family homing endonuclease [Virgibacillus halotolerans]MBM7600615.1 hypothetical protein [Virgibacillus halotolerans]